MLPKVLEAYQKQGYRVDLGSPARLYSTVVDLRGRRTVNCSGGFTVSDVFLFMAVARVIRPANILVIGNSFGLSTFVLAELFPNARIDAIDAELEDVEPALGSEITRKIAATDFPQVELTIGSSPQDLEKAARGKKYGFVFVDAMHTNEAVIMDYRGVQSLMDSACMIYFHDVANCNMHSAWDIIRRDARAKGFESYEFGFSQMGCTALVRGYPGLSAYFALSANPFSGPYLNGYTSDNRYEASNRPFFWDLSFSQIERLIRRKIGNLLRDNRQAEG